MQSLALRKATFSFVCFMTFVGFFECVVILCTIVPVLIVPYVIVRLWTSKKELIEYMTAWSTSQTLHTPQTNTESNVSGWSRDLIALGRCVFACLICVIAGPYYCEMVEDGSENKVNSEEKKQNNM